MTYTVSGGALNSTQTKAYTARVAVVFFAGSALCAEFDFVRGVEVRERGGTPLRQKFCSRNGAPANIVGHRWNVNTERVPANHVVLVRLEP